MIQCVCASTQQSNFRHERENERNIFASPVHVHIDDGIVFGAALTLKMDKLKLIMCTVWKTFA